MEGSPMPIIILKEFGQHNGQHVWRQKASLLVLLLFFLFFPEELGLFLRDF